MQSFENAAIHRRPTVHIVLVSFQSWQLTALGTEGGAFPRDDNASPEPSSRASSKTRLLKYLG